MVLVPAETSPDGRTWISGVRELDDGRVIVVDRNEFTVFLYSQALREQVVVGREGEGPGEYKAPSGLIALPGDSTVVVDRGQGRLLVLGPDATPTNRVIRHDALADARFLASASAPPPSVDVSNLWYFEGAASSGYLSEKIAFDSIAIERRASLFSPNADTVVSFPNAEDWRGVPRYRPAPAWAVCGDGMVYVAFPEPYHVEVTGGPGPVVIGPRVEYQPVVVTDRVVGVWRQLEQTYYSVSSVQARGGGGTSYMFNPIRPEDLDKWDWWPETLPPFGADAVHCGPRNQLWVQRTPEPGAAPLVDVFGPDGRRVRQFELPTGVRIVGFGSQSVYAVFTDELALQYLARIPVPN
jgi:hypothetical protein